MTVERSAIQLSNPADLQAQIDRAPDGSVVLVPAGRIPASLVISKPIILRGAGAERTILEGKGRGPVIAVDAGEGEVRIEEMSITQGRGGNGGAIVVDNGAQVHVVGCLLEKNAAKAGRGGAIAVESGALWVTECTLVDNRALLGGAIYVGAEAKLELAASILADNYALRGGGLAVTDGAEVTVWTSRLENNRAELEGHHLATFGSKYKTPRILLANAYLSVTDSAGLAIANDRSFRATIAIEDSTVGRDMLPMMRVG